MWTKVVASGIFLSNLFNFVLSVLNFAFLTTCLSTTSYSFFKSTGTVFYLLTSKLFKLLGTLTKLLMSSMSTSTFKVINLSTPVACSNYFLVA